MHPRSPGPFRAALGERHTTARARRTRRTIRLRPAFLALLAWFASARGDGGGGGTAACPPPGQAGASEACVRAELGIPPEAARVLLLSQSSHLDWDWLRTFDDYYRQLVERIFSDAVDLMGTFHDAPHRYYYSIASWPKSSGTHA